MAELKLTINDQKTGKSYMKVLETDLFKNMKIKDKVKGDDLGLKDYELEITGGSDTAGFPMRPDLNMAIRKKALLTSGPGLHSNRKGLKKRKTIRGNQISPDIVQINLKIIKAGSKNIEELLGKKEEPKQETKEEK